VQELPAANDYCFFSLDGSSVLELLPGVAALLEVESLEGGVLPELPAAAPEDDVLGEVLEPLPLAEPVVEPPGAESFFAMSPDEDGELEDEDGELGALVVPDADPEAEPDGELGEVAEPEDDVGPEPGAARRSPVLSPQAASILAPSAMEIATAKAESLIFVGLRGWGKGYGARFGPTAVR
jgi:hypothetical protein